MRNARRYLALPLALATLTAFTIAPADGSERAPLFADDAVLDITIDAPMTTLMDVRPDEAYLKGSFSFTDADGTEKRVSLKLRTRGNYRRDPEHCDFAPIRLNLVKGEIKNTLFDGQDKLKLVTHCRTLEPEFEEHVFSEYLAYRMFQELTDISYGTRLLRITYFDTQKGRDKTTRFGFVIEDDKDVARRNDLELVKVKRLSHEYHDPHRHALVDLFEFMIGNTEYSLVNPEPGKDCCHNTDVLSETGGPPFISLPFDFDFSGLVNAPYAEPNPRYPIGSVRKRYYRGQCSANDVLPETIKLFQSRREALYQAIESIRGISTSAARSSRSVEDFVDGFYKIIEDPKVVREQLIEKCQPPDE
jgi:hypothetical protein